MGRPKQYRNESEKQRAYRERKKALERARTEADWLLEEYERRIVTLRNMVSRMKSPELVYRPPLGGGSNGIFQLLEGGYARANLDPLLRNLLLQRGDLILTGRRAMGDELYQLRSVS